MEVGAVALEEHVRRRWREENIEIARRAAAQPASPSPDRRIRVPSSTPGGMLTESARSASCRPTPPQARAGILDDLAAALAGRTGALEREEALRVPDLALAAARRADLGLGARLGAASGAGLAGDRRRNPHLSALAAVRLLRVSSPCCSANPRRARGPVPRPRRPPPMPKKSSKMSANDVANSAPKPGRPPTGLLEGRMAKTIISRAFIPVLAGSHRPR